MDGTGIFTYDATLPTARDRMRHALGDTTEPPLRYDETYDALLSYYEGDEALATAKLARALATQFGRKPSSVSVPGGPSVNYSDRVKSWSDLATVMEKTAAETTTTGVGFTDVRLDRGAMTDFNQSEYRRPLDVWPSEGW